MRPAVNPPPAGYETAAVRRNVCAPGSEPSPCRLPNSRRPEGRVSTRRARTTCRTGYRTSEPAPPRGVSAQLSQTTRPTVPHPTPPAMTHHHHTMHAHPPPHTQGPSSGLPADTTTIKQSSHNHHHHPPPSAHNFTNNTLPPSSTHNAVAKHTTIRPAPHLQHPHTPHHPHQKPPTPPSHPYHLRHRHH